MPLTHVSTQTSASASLLAQLIALPTVSCDSNLAFIAFVADLLKAHGINAALVHSQDGRKANLFASVGPENRPGVLLSGHTDVVPALGQVWTSDPFAMRTDGGRYYGRGAADMKGFIACAVQAMLAASKCALGQPLQLALSYDEEIGCIGVRRLIDVLEGQTIRPSVCIIGEPTMMQVVTGHKGKTALHALCRGQEAHSSLAPTVVNAVHLGCELVGEIRQLQNELAQTGAQDADYDIAYSTFHVGTFSGGKTLNIVPNRCEIDFELRNVAADKPDIWIDKLRERAAVLAAHAQRPSPAAGIDIEIRNSYPGLDTSITVQAVAFVQSVLSDIGLPSRNPRKVAFGTEGGLFSSRLNTPVVVCGPGSIDVAHKPDEYVEHSQLDLCDAFLARLVQVMRA